jgi:dihydroorotase-like cyclic amidohydrolase
LPTYGIILIENQNIVDVITVDESIPIRALQDKYSEWNPEIYEDFYISPGNIEINVRKEWEDFTTLSMMAASGGVTLLVEEKNIHHSGDSPLAKHIYCDIARIQRIDSSHINTIQALAEQKPLAFKGYLYPPSWKVLDIQSELNAIMEEVSRTNIPLIIDPVFAQERFLHLSSPCRNMPLQDRIRFQVEDDPRLFAAALPDEIDPASSSDEDDVPERWVLARTRSISSALISKHNTSKEFECKKTFNPIEEEEGEESPIKFRNPKRLNSVVCNETKTNGKRRNSYHTIYDDLEIRIKEVQNDIENLSRVEQMTYSDAGSTTFKRLRRSSSCSNMAAALIYSDAFKKLINNAIAVTEHSPTPYVPPPSTLPSTKPSEPLSPPNARLENRRPPTLMIAKTPPNKENKTRDLSYTSYLVNYPDHWETNGVILILKALKHKSCKVHIANLSCAAAVNKVRHRKKKYLNLSCDTCAHYLFFSDGYIPPGCTSFKDSPPIRSQKNKELLLDLLKLKGIDMISSHHASIPIDLKDLDGGDFKKALGGVNSLGFTMQAVWTLFKNSEVSHATLDHYIVRLSKWMSLAPARLLNISDIRGGIERGKYADLIIWKPYEKVKGFSLSNFTETAVYHKKDLYGRIYKVFLRGNLVYNENCVFAHGKKL